MTEKPLSSTGMWHGRLIKTEGSPCSQNEGIHELLEMNHWGHPRRELTCVVDVCNYEGSDDGQVFAWVPDDMTMTFETDYPNPPTYKSLAERDGSEYTEDLRRQDEYWEQWKKNREEFFRDKLLTDKKPESI